MSTTLEPADLTGATVGTTGTIDLTQVTGPGGISYAIGGQATLRLHNESNCGLRCMFDNSGQSFNLPAGGWSDSYPKSSDNALDFTVLYTLSGPGVTLLLSTYYFPGEPVPAQTTLGNSPIGGGNVSTNFSELINTGNNPLSTLINVQPNDASAPTWTADNSGNLAISGDNAGVLTTLLQLIAGASPAVKLAAAGVLTATLGDFQVGGNAILMNNKNLELEDSGGTPHAVMFASSFNNVVIRALAGVSGRTIALQDESGTTQLTIVDTSPQVTVANNLQVNGNLTKAALATSTSGLSTGGTIATTTPIAKPTPGSAVTGIILQPGTVDGQVMGIINLGLAGASITFAPSSTSHVEDGTSDVIASGNAALFLWEGTNARWYRIYPN